MRTGILLERARTGFATFWRTYIVDECPDEKIERLRRERLANIEADVVLLEAMRRWEIENDKFQEQKEEKTPSNELIASC